MTGVLRIASHIHSAWSDDCSWPLEKLAGTLRRVGFDGALVCDHDRTMTDRRRDRMVAECAEITARGFLMVPGVEYQDAEHVVHLPVFGDLPFYGRGTPLVEILRDSAAAGGVSVFAHPARRSAFERFDSSWAPFLTGIEVWNRKYDGVQPNRWAASAARRHGLRPFVGLDFHGPRQLYPLALAVHGVSAPTWQPVLDALRAGRFRATAFGLDVASFTEGRLGGMVRRAEVVRKAVAPRVRAVERAVRARGPSTPTVSQAAQRSWDPQQPGPSGAEP